MRRAWVGLLLGGIVALGAAPSASPDIEPIPSPTPVPATTAWPIDIEATIVLDRPTLAVTKAFADTLEGGIHLVPVRIVEAMDVAVTLTSTDDLVLAEAPLVCLHWRDAAPDDAGLESPCWGVPDLSATLADLGAVGDAWVLVQGQTVRAGATIRRAPGTCDYPPGEWVLRLRVVPLVDGSPQEPLYLRRSFAVPFDRTAVPRDVPLSESRFCGLASEIIVDQGVPPTAAP